MKFAACSRSSGHRTSELDLENLVYARVAKSKQRRKGQSVSNFTREYKILKELRQRQRTQLRSSQPTPY